MSWQKFVSRSFAALAVLLTAGGGFAQKVSTLHVGTLTEGDLQLDSGEYYDQYEVEAGSGEEIIATVMALEFDPYLIVISPSGDQIDNDDFGGSNDVSLIEVPVDEPGRWKIRVTSYDTGESGEYALMAATRAADGIDAGEEEETEFEEEEPEDFVVSGPIELGRTIEGRLDADDRTRYDGSHYEAYAITVEPGTHLVITLESDDFDAFLTLVSPSGAIESNDDGEGAEEGDTTSRIETTLAEGGRWIVVANTLEAGETGDYRLTVGTQ